MAVTVGLTRYSYPFVLLSHIQQIDHFKSDGLNSAATIEELRAEIAKLREEIAIYLW